MKKKIYIQPDTCVIEIECNKLLQSSDTGALLKDGSADSNTTVESKGNDDWDEDY